MDDGCEDCVVLKYPEYFNFECEKDKRCEKYKSLEEWTSERRNG